MVGLYFASHWVSFAGNNRNPYSDIGWSSSSSLYNPVTGSGCGAQSNKSFTLKLASPIWSFEESLSQSRIVSWTWNAVSYRRTWKRSFSSQTGLSECRMTRVRNTFLPNEMTTNGSISQPVRVTNKYFVSQRRKAEKSETRCCVNVVNR